jgi:nucleolar protein 14
MKTKKGKKRNQADSIYAKKSKVIAKKANPFELHQNREKFDVLNRIDNRSSRGKPLVSRQLALEKRKQTIGVEYKQKNKSNLFQDNRKAGFKAPKESIYNLNESEVLTHHGQSVADIERFDDFVHEEDDHSDDETRLNGKINSKFIGINNN